MPASNSFEDRLETFKSFLSDKGFRVTAQRTAIFTAALEYESHYTAEELLDSARQIDSSVSRSTVYRALPILVESGLVEEVDVGHDNKYYRATPLSHNPRAQVVCDDCGKIFEFEAPFLDWYGKAAAQKAGLEPISQRLQVIAKCPNASGNQVCEHAINTGFHRR